MSEASTTTNPRREAALLIYGEGMHHWEYMLFLNEAKKYALEKGMGVRELKGLSAYYHEKEIVVIDKDEFTLACVDMAKERRPKRGRPYTGFDKKAYNREYMRKKRQALKKDSKA